MANKLILTIVGAASIAALAGCGGGGSDAAQSSEPAAVVIRGRVIYQAPVKESRVTVHDAAGRSWESTTDSSGDFAITVPSIEEPKGPLIVRATGEGVAYASASGSVARSGDLALAPALVPATVDKSQGQPTSFTLYAVGTPTTPTVVTPASSLVVGVLSSSRSDGLFAAFGKAGATSTVDAVSAEKVQAAQSKVKSTLAQLGLPVALIDDPTSSSLVASDVTSAYDRLASGDVFGAMAAALAAANQNAMNFGCEGDAYGLMADDGQRRPSCLPGKNMDASLLSTPFIPFETPRSLDPETRATELSDGDSPTGGWKYVHGRKSRADRISALQDRLIVAIQRQDVEGKLNGDANEALSALSTWPDSRWNAALKAVCESVPIEDISDLSYSYRAMKRDMRSGPFAPTIDAAENLFMSGIKTRAVNRMLPVFYSAGPADLCPVFTVFAGVAKNALPESKDMVSRPPLAALLADAHAAGPAVVPTMSASLKSGVLSDEWYRFLQADGRLAGYYPDVVTPDDFVEFLQSACPPAGMTDRIDYCPNAATAMSTYLSKIDARAAKVPAEVANGQTAVANTVLSALTASLAARIIDEYEKNFDVYYARAPAESYDAFDVQGFAIDAMRKADARDAVILMPDISQSTISVVGTDIRIGGQFNMTRQEMSISAVSYGEGDVPKRRLLAMRVHPKVLPGLAVCFSADEACLARLRRTKAFTPASAALSNSERPSTALISISIRWREQLGVAASHTETVLFNSPQYLAPPNDSIIDP